MVIVEFGQYLIFLFIGGLSVFLLLSLRDHKRRVDEKLAKQDIAYLEHDRTLTRHDSDSVRLKETLLRMEDLYKELLKKLG